ncbi:MAG: STAS domain-containing protein [Acidimicrobiales bacterium]|nr:STAS domain-containing protein [Acidimicrobiales bacterium]
MVDLTTVIVVQAGEAVLRATGEVHAGNVERFERAIRQYGTKFSQVAIVVDLAGASFVDGAGPAMLDRIDEEFPGRLRIRHAPTRTLVDPQGESIRTST